MQNKEQITQERWLKASQVAKILNIHMNTMHKYLHDGTIPGKKIGHHWRIPESGLRDFLDKN